jgi:Mn-dependent DtxR family transcriptional regulator
MKISKQIMNPARIQQLQIIEDAVETNINFVSYRSGNKDEAVELSIKRFDELGLIQFTNKGYFEISEKGKEYLNHLRKEGIPILETRITEYENEKYQEAINLIKEINSGETVSVSMFQRRIRVGYGLGTAIIQKLLKEGYLESYQQWVGTTINGEKKDGYYIKMFRTK